jgi:hypothetical protein
LPFLALAVAAGLAFALAGCISTEQKATWLHITDARIIASQHSTVVRHPGDAVRVTRVTLLHSGKRVAVVVGLQNVTARPVNDIPISVGLRPSRGPRVYLNRAANVDYFKTHVAAIPARGSVTWVFTAHRHRPLAGRVFAVAGSESSPPVTVARALPALHAVLAAEAARGTSASGSGASAATPSAPRAPARTGGSDVTVTITNLSAVPQVGLQVYAVAGGSGRYSAAGSATVPELGTGKTATARIDLIGSPHGAPLQLEALPTLFQ